MQLFSRKHFSAPTAILGDPGVEDFDFTMVNDHGQDAEGASSASRPPALSANSSQSHSDGPHIYVIHNALV